MHIYELELQKNTLRVYDRCAHVVWGIRFPSLYTFHMYFCDLTRVRDLGMACLHISTRTHAHIHASTLPHSVSIYAHVK